MDTSIRFLLCCILGQALGGVGVAAAVSAPATPLADVDFHVNLAATGPLPSIRIMPTNGTSFLATASELPEVQRGDQLMGVNGMPVSSLSLMEALQSEPNTTHVLPLVAVAEELGLGGILQGFVRIEIIRPSKLQFRPTTDDRKKKFGELKKKKTADLLKKKQAIVEARKLATAAKQVAEAKAKEKAQSQRLEEAEKRKKVREAKKR